MVSRTSGATVFAIALLAVLGAQANPPLYLSHHWHYHQPIYWPYESVTETASRGAYSYDLTGVFTSRSGPYSDWPITAVESGMNWGFSNIGAQASLSGSLIENLNNLESAGWAFGGWKGRWQQSTAWQTALGNPRLDIVNFGYHHPLMALVDPMSVQLQIEMHQAMVQRAFGISPSKGMFPPECAFTPRMIPALKAAGVEWIMADSIHLERTHVDYPWNNGSQLIPPNGADVLSEAPTDWVALQNVWAPSPVAAPWAYRPHYAVFIDPETGEEQRMVVVPAARYEGNEDARGGYGALIYDTVLSSYLAQNTDDQHPMLVLMAHDGDNYGANVESYYMSNWEGMLSWLQGSGGAFIDSTVQDYLDQFPPDATDTIHVEDGAWSGAANGDSEFSKWNGAPGDDGYSPDRNSWAVLVATVNHVQTAETLDPHSSPEAIIDANGSDTDLAWHWMLVAETSCYWYWDNSEDGLWDSHPTRAANEAVVAADRVFSAHGSSDTVGPTLYPPQRDPYNPGAYEWTDTPEPTIFDVWTLAYDRSGLSEITLEYRVDNDLCRDVENEVYATGGWISVPMTASSWSSRTDPSPTVQADQYTATVDAGTNVLVDYYIRAVDSQGNVTKSPIGHVMVGTAGGDTSGDWEPAAPTNSDIVTVYGDRAGWLHWGVNGWQEPNAAYWPADTAAWGDGQSVESLLLGPDGDGRYHVEIGPFNNGAQAVSEVNFVVHGSDGTWSSPDQTIPISSAMRSPPKACIPYYASGGWDGDTGHWDTGHTDTDDTDTDDPDDTDTDNPDDTDTNDSDDTPQDSAIEGKEPGGCGCGGGGMAGTLLGLMGMLGAGMRRKRR